MPDASFDRSVRMAVYGRFAAAGERPAPGEIAGAVGSDVSTVLRAFRRLREQRVLWLETDGTIRMAPPFSGVPTQHVVEADDVRYFANCAWDALGIPAALRRPAVVHSRCEQSREELTLDVGLEGSEPSDWLFHCLVPAAQWWDDLPFT